VASITLVNFEVRFQLRLNVLCLGKKKVIKPIQKGQKQSWQSNIFGLAGSADYLFKAVVMNFKYS
jgi:hypothetical protein